MSDTQTPSEVAQKLGDAFALRDLGRLATLLHPQVRWGGDEETDETCHGPDAVVDAAPHYQVFRVADSLVDDIRGSSDRTEAQRLLG